jgi:hypothetical protein
MTGAERQGDRAVISFEQSERLSGDPPPEAFGGPRTVEILAYIGAIGAFIATIAAVIKVSLPADPLLGLLMGNLDNVPGGLIALVGAVVVFGTGYRFAGTDGAVRRASGFLLLLGYLLAAGGFGLLLFDLDLGDATPLVVLVPSAAVAVAGWRRLRSVPTQLALFIVAVNAVRAILILTQVEELLDPTAMAMTAALGGTPDFGSWISHLVYVALGLAWVWAGHSALIVPRNAAFFVGSSFALVFGLALFESADGWMILSGALVIAYAWAAMRWRSSVLAAVGAIAATVAIVQVMSLVYDDPPGTTDVILWFGIPGVLALIVAWGLALPARGAPEAAPESPPESPTD